MNIQLQKQPTFNARNSTIRFADDIVRKVNKEYPRVSVTKLESLNNSKKFSLLLNELWEATANMRGLIRGSYTNSMTFANEIRAFLLPIKFTRLGNCKESAQLAFIAAKANGIKNCKMAYLESPDGFDYDHAVVLVKGKKPYVIDAWLGFADYIPKAIERYQKEFRNCFDFDNAKTEKMLVKEDFGLLQNFLNSKTSSKKEISEIKRICSNLILNKS